MVSFSDKFPIDLLDVYDIYLICVIKFCRKKNRGMFVVSVELGGASLGDDVGVWEDGIDDNRFYLMGFNIL